MMAGQAGHHEKADFSEETVEAAEAAGEEAVCAG